MCHCTNYAFVFSDADMIDANNANYPLIACADMNDDNLDDCVLLYKLLPARYFSNNGDDLIEQLGIQNVFSNIEVSWVPGYLDSIVLGDFDNDLDNDLAMSFSGSNVIYYENSGSVAVAQFTNQTLNPFDEFYSSSQRTVYCYDFDDDSDLDCLKSDYFNVAKYLRNDAVNGLANFTLLSLFDPTNPFYGTYISDSFTMSCFDSDGDGDGDCIIYDWDFNYLFLEKNGSHYQPVYSYSQLYVSPSRGLGYDIGASSFSCGYDWDGDEDLDCLSVGYDDIYLIETVCNYGHYLDTNSANMAAYEACTPCTVGRFSKQYDDQTFNDSCDECFPGYYNNDVGQYECDKCSVGRYNVDSGSDSGSACLKCPHRMSTQYSASPSPNNCSYEFLQRSWAFGDKSGGVESDYPLSSQISSGNFDHTEFGNVFLLSGYTQSIDWITPSINANWYDAFVIGVARNGSSMQVLWGHKFQSLGSVSRDVITAMSVTPVVVESRFYNGSILESIVYSNRTLIAVCGYTSGDMFEQVNGSDDMILSVFLEPDLSNIPADLSMLELDYIFSSQIGSASYDNWNDIDIMMMNQSEVVIVESQLCTNEPQHDSCINFTSSVSPVYFSHVLPPNSLRIASVGTTQGSLFAPEAVSYSACVIMVVNSTGGYVFAKQFDEGYSSCGNIAFVNVKHTIGTSMPDPWIYDIAFSVNVYDTGINSSIDQTLYGSGDIFLFAMRLGHNGSTIEWFPEVLWSRIVGGTGYDACTGLSVIRLQEFNLSDEIAVLGFFTSNFTFQNHSEILSIGYDYQSFIVAIDATTQKDIWFQHVGSPSYDFFSVSYISTPDIIHDSSDSITYNFQFAMAGYTSYAYATDNFGGSDGVCSVYNASMFYDRQTDVSTTFIERAWLGQFGSSGSEKVIGVYLESDGRVTLIGDIYDYEENDLFGEQIGMTDIFMSVSVCSDGFTTSGYDCIPCPPATFFNETSFACSACPIGTFAASPGYDDCLPCEPGHYQTQQGQQNCSACLGGYYNLNNGSITPSDCLQCLPGTYSTSGDGACTDCPIGTFSNVNGSSSCSLCAVGTANSEKAMTECVACDFGKFADALGTVTCADCPSGSFSSQSGSSSCSPCQAGSYNELTGQSQCLLCIPNTYNPTEGSAGKSACLQCPSISSSSSGSVEEDDCQNLTASMSLAILGLIATTLLIYPTFYSGGLRKACFRKFVEDLYPTVFLYNEWRRRQNILFTMSPSIEKSYSSHLSIGHSMKMKSPTSRLSETVAKFIVKVLVGFASIILFAIVTFCLYFASIIKTSVTALQLVLTDTSTFTFSGYKIALVQFGVSIQIGAVTQFLVVIMNALSSIDFSTIVGDIGISCRGSQAISKLAGDICVIIVFVSIAETGLFPFLYITFERAHISFQQQLRYSSGLAKKAARLMLAFFLPYTLQNGLKYAMQLLASWIVMTSFFPYHPWTNQCNSLKGSEGIDKFFAIFSTFFIYFLIVPTLITLLHSASPGIPRRCLELDDTQKIGEKDGIDQIYRERSASSVDNAISKRYLEKLHIEDENVMESFRHGCKKGVNALARLMLTYFTFGSGMLKSLRAYIRFLDPGLTSDSRLREQTRSTTFGSFSFTISGHLMYDANDAGIWARTIKPNVAFVKDMLIIIGWKYYMLLKMSFGVWNDDVIESMQVAERTFVYASDDAEGCYLRYMTAAGQSNAMLWQLIPGMLPLAKLCEFANESPVFVQSQHMKFEPLLFDLKNVIRALKSDPTQYGLSGLAVSILAYCTCITGSRLTKFCYNMINFSIAVTCLFLGENAEAIQRALIFHAIVNVPWSAVISLGMCVSFYSQLTSSEEDVIAAQEKDVVEGNHVNETKNNAIDVFSQPRMSGFLELMGMGKSDGSQDSRSNKGKSRQRIKELKMRDSDSQF